MPVCVKSVQVDGGSEFRGAFNEKALEVGLKVYVLPARRPQRNGVVERFNRTLRDAFYSGYGGRWSVGGVSEAFRGLPKTLQRGEMPHSSRSPALFLCSKFAARRMTLKVPYVLVCYTSCEKVLFCVKVSLVMC